MTPKQWKLLEAIGRHSREGTMEVLLAMEYEPASESEADQEKAWNLTRRVVASMAKALADKGLVTIDDDGYGITDHGVLCLFVHEEQSKARAK